MKPTPKCHESELSDIAELQELALNLSETGMFDWDIAGGRVKHIGFQLAMFSLPEGWSPCRESWLLPGIEDTKDSGAGDVLNAVMGAAEDCKLELCARYALPCGDQVWLHMQSRLTLSPTSGAAPRRRLRGILRDVTLARKRENLYTTILESIGDGFVSFDADWRYTFVNRKAEGLLGRSSEQLIGRTIWDVFPEVSGSALETTFRAAMQGTPKNYEYYYAPWERWFANYCAPKFDGGLTVYFQDITERKAAEQERERANSRVVLDQINVAAQTLSALAHELNQPLMVLQANNVSLAHLLQGTEVKEEVISVLAENDVQASRASSIFPDLVFRIRAWRQGNLSDDWYDLHVLIERCVRYMVQKYSGVIFDLELVAQNTSLHGDQLQTEKSLLNLFVNAVEASQCTDNNSHRISVKTSCTLDRILIQVADTGPGISEKVQQHLFTEFKSTKQYGLGLGLCISKSLIEAQGGRLWFHANLEPGAEFRIELPLPP